MSTFLVVCGQQIDIGRRVVTFLEENAPSFPREKELTGQTYFSVRPGVPAGASLDVLAQRVYMICIHHDATWDSLACYNVLKNRGFSTHLMIDGNGMIIQPIDLMYNTWHASDVNAVSIGIDMNNVATLSLLTDTDRGRAYAAARGGLFTQVINGAKLTSTGYTEEQYASLVAVIVGLHKVLPKIKLFPPLDQTGEVIERKLVNHTRFHGFLGHFHTSAHKWDPGPGFDWRRVMVGIHGERNVFPVKLPNVSALNKVYSTAETMQVAEAYYNKVESGSSGYYPVSLSQAWHSGIHLNVSRGQPVVCMARGTIVAVRNVQEAELGDPSFVLVRHTIRSKPKLKKSTKAAAPKAGDKEKASFVEKTWYSLYMHLQFISEKTPLTKRPAWYRELGDKEGSGEDKFVDTDVDEEGGDRRPKTGKNFHDLRAGRIILMDREVKAGEPVGYVGSFGVREELHRDCIHLETFSTDEDPLFEPTEFPETWKAIEADEGNDSLADIDEIWRPIFDATNFLRNENVKLRRGERILKASEIQEFFQGDSKDRLAFRGYVCRHPSEWSDTLDWKKTAPVAVGWQWETAEAFKKFVRLWEPFMWMNTEVIEHCKLDDKRRVWTYHPVTLISWFHTNYGRQLSPEEYQEGFSNQALVEQRKLEDAMEAQGTYKSGWHGSGETDGAIIDAVDLRQLELDDEPWKEHEQGEWPLGD